MSGHAGAPSLDETTEFISAVKLFTQAHPGEVIALHCTHGFNRTGFLIVAYLVDECQYSLEMALEEFRGCRPDGIYKEDYLQELHDRYADATEMVHVSSPGWLRLD